MTNATTLDPRQLRDVLGTFVTGVTIVTTRDAAGVAHGVTANSFSSVSLDPPLVLWSQSLSSKSYPAFRDSDHFAINILADDQVDLSNRFAKSSDDKFSGVEHVSGVGDAPVLGGTAATLECVKVATYPGGDHTVYIGRVERMSRSNRRPLAFGSGRYMVAYSHDLGPVSLQLGSSTPGHLDAVRLATEAMPRLCEEAGNHTACLAVWGNHGPTIIRWEASRHPVSEHLRTGLVVSVTRSAVGMAFAAFLPQETTRALVAEDLRLFRPEGEDEASQRRRFEEQLADVRQHGMSRSIDANSPLHQIATNAFSAPIFNGNGDMVLALAITSQATRLDPDWNGSVPLALGEVAKAISKELGYTGSSLSP